MTYTTGTLSGLNLLDGLALPQGKSRRVIFGAIAIGLGIVALVWVIATIAAACIMVASLTTHPNIHGEEPIAPPMAPKMIVLANPYGALATAADFPSPAPILTDPAQPPDFSVDAALEPATADPFAAALPPKRADELADNAPTPPADPLVSSPLPPKREIARSSPRRMGSGSPPRHIQRPILLRRAIAIYFKSSLTH